MFKKLLVPLDGSEFSESALPLALSVAERTEAELHLVSAVSTFPPLMFSDIEDPHVKGWFAEERVRAERHLDEVRDRIRVQAPDLTVHRRVLSGTPVDALDERIRATGVDLVVMTTHGRGTLERFWLGSVADGLIRRGPCAILLWRPGKQDVGPEERPEFRNILLPLDGSDPSRAVVPRALDLAKAFGAVINLLTVAPDVFPVASAYLPPTPMDPNDATARAEMLRSQLEDVASTIRSEGVGVRLDVVSANDPAEAILKYRREIDADLVAMSTRGLGGVSRMVLGSVADKVIRAGSVPVLIHRQADPDQ